MITERRFLSSYLEKSSKDILMVEGEDTFPLWFSPQNLSDGKRHVLSATKILSRYPYVNRRN